MAVSTIHVLIALGIVGLFGVITFALAAATIGTLNKQYNDLKDKIDNLSPTTTTVATPVAGGTTTTAAAGGTTTTAAAGGTTTTAAAGGTTTTTAAGGTTTTTAAGGTNSPITDTSATSDTSITSDMTTSNHS